MDNAPPSRTQGLLKRRRRDGVEGLGIAPYKRIVPRLRSEEGGGEGRGAPDSEVALGRASGHHASPFFGTTGYNHDYFGVQSRKQHCIGSQRKLLLMLLLLPSSSEVLSCTFGHPQETCLD